MARDAAEARRMLAASRIHPDLVAQIVPSPMTLRVDRTIQRLMADGLLGELLVVEARVSTGFLDRDAPLHWRQDAGLSGRNIMSMGIWYEAMMRWVGTARRVSAMGRTFVPRRRDASGRACATHSCRSTSTSRGSCTAARSSTCRCRR